MNPSVGLSIRLLKLGELLFQGQKSADTGLVPPKNPQILTAIKLHARSPLKKSQG
ncbi:MAG: hypothetical protein AAF892_05455 [Cyanobacteria bacterium P01_D01_bin.71]